MKSKMRFNWKSILIILCLILLVWLVGSSCNVKKHIQKSEDKQEINSHVAETTTTTTTYTGNIEVSADTSRTVDDLDPFLEGKPIIAETDDFKSEARLDKKTGKINTTLIQKQKSVPISGTVTTSGSKISDTKIKSEKKEILKDKKVTTFPWWIWLILAIALIYGCWRVKEKLTK